MNNKEMSELLLVAIVELRMSTWRLWRDNSLQSKNCFTTLEKLWQAMPNFHPLCAPKHPASHIVTMRAFPSMVRGCNFIVETKNL